MSPLPSNKELKEDKEAKFPKFCREVCARYVGWVRKGFPEDVTLEFTLERC